MRGLLVILLFVVLVGSQAALSGPPEPVGDQFQVNAYTTAVQDRPAVARVDDSAFVVVWESSGSNGTDTGRSIQGRRFVVDGSPGFEFQVNSYTTWIQEGPAIGVDGSGGFVVVWASDGSVGSDTHYFGIEGQRYAADGAALGGEFAVNSYTTGNQYDPAVSAAADGFVVVWTSFGSVGDDVIGDSIQGQRYAADGTPLDSQFQVNSVINTNQTRAAASPDGADGFVVVWQSFASGGSDDQYQSIQAQRYAADGTPLGGEFQVNTYTTNSQVFPAVAAGDGVFLVVWSSVGSSGPDNDGGSVQGQLYASDGSPIGGEFQINDYSPGYQNLPAVAGDGAGAFVVVWSSSSGPAPDTDGFAVLGRRVSADGALLGDEFVVNAYTTEDQSVPDVSTDGAGGFVVTWQSEGSYGTDTDNRSVQARRFTARLFEDGFESGDTTAWSLTVP